MTLKVGDRVRVRFDLSKINDMDRFVESLRAQGEHIPESYPIGYAYGTVVNKSYWWPSSKERKPMAVVLFDNGDDFYIIDMARAVNSALLKCVPKELLKPYKEDWLVKLPGLFENKEGMDE